MSAGRFHVHGPHDHELEHAAHSADPLAGRIAVMTAIFATIAALFGYMAGATQNDALMFKNEAAAEQRSEAAMHNYHRWAQAMTLIQIGIALAAITILTRITAMGLAALGVAGASIILGGLAFAHI